MQPEYTDPEPPVSYKLAFNAAFAPIEERRDIGHGPKRLYALLVTVHRQKIEITHEEIARRLGAGKHSIVRWSQALVKANLLAVHRPGLGNPNRYTLLGIDQANLDGKATEKWIIQRRVYKARLARLIELYGAQCLNCGSPDRLQIDHVVPLARGGPDTFTNLQILCRPCNIDKMTKTIDYRPSLL